MTFQKFSSLGILVALGCAYACGANGPDGSVVTTSDDTSGSGSPTSCIDFGDIGESKCANPIYVRQGEIEIPVCFNEEVPPTVDTDPPTNDVVPPTVDTVPPTTDVVPPTNDVVPPTTDVVPPTTDYVPPTGNGGTGGSPDDDYVPPSNGGTGGTGGSPDGGAPPVTDGGTTPPPPQTCEDTSQCPEGNTCKDHLCGEDPVGDPPCTGHDEPEPEPTCAEHKTKICHIPHGNGENAHTICVGNPAVPTHLEHCDADDAAHCDYLGPCTGDDALNGHPLNQ